MAESVKRRRGDTKHNQIEASATFATALQEHNTENTIDWPSMVFTKSEAPVSAREMPSDAQIKAARHSLSLQDSGAKRVRSNSVEKLKVDEEPASKEKQNQPVQQRQFKSLTIPLPGAADNSSSSDNSKVFDIQEVKKLNTMQKFPTRSRSMLNRGITFQKKERFSIAQKANIEAILTIAFLNKGNKFHEEQQLAKHISVMEEVKENIDIEEGIFIFRNKAPCGFQIPCDETEYVRRQFQRHEDEKRLNQIASEPIEEETAPKGELEGNWEHTQKIVVYDGRSLYLFHHSTMLRRVVVAVTEDKKFENLILLLIILNSICLIAYDYTDRGNNYDYNQYLESSMSVFTWFFIGEAVLKIISQGFIRHKNSYLRDPWNFLDMTVVITALIEIIFKRQGGQNFKGLRTLRVFRPLRSINRFPAMKRLIRSLGASVGPLMQVVFFLTVVFILFSILGVKQFYGSFYQRCRTTSAPVYLVQDGVNETVWPFDTQVDRLCSKNDRGHQCPIGQICGTPFDVGLPLSSDHPEKQKLINYGVTTFDNLFFGFITIFQMITKEGWTILMYDLVDSGQPIIARAFCVSIIVSCAFFLLNVFLAVLAESIEEASKEDPYEIKRKDEISKSLLRARTQKRKHLKKSDSLQSFLEYDQILVSRKTTEVVKKGETRNTMLNKYNSMQPSSRSRLSSKESAIAGTKDQKATGILNPSFIQEDPLLINPDKFSSVALSITRNSEIRETLQSQVPATEVKFTNLSQNEAEGVNDEFKEVDDPEGKLQTIITQSFIQKKRLSEKMPAHVLTSNFLQLCYGIARSSLFNFAFILITIINTVTLASYYKGISKQEMNVLDTMERIFRWLFLTEMLIKLMGLGFRQYIRDGFNALEAVLVVFSMVEEGFTMADLKLHAGAFTAFRALRLLRIFRLARSWKTLHELVNMMEKSIKDVSTFSVLLLIMMTIFLLLGRELFAHRIKFEDKALITPLQTCNDVYVEGFSPLANFDWPGIGFITIFLVIVGDDWNIIMYDYYRVLYNQDNQHTQAYFSVLYFVLLFVVGNIVLLNLFLAILLANFDMNREEEDDYLEDSEIENQTNSCVMFWVWLRLKLASCCPKYFVKPPLAEQEDTTSSSSNSESEEESPSPSPENKDSNSRSQQSRDRFDDMFQMESNRKKETNQLELQLLKIRAENIKKSQVRNLQEVDPPEVQTKPANLTMMITGTNSQQASAAFDSRHNQLLDLKLKEVMKEGGDSENDSSEFQQSQPRLSSKRNSSQPVSSIQTSESKQNSQPRSQKSDKKREETKERREKREELRAQRKQSMKKTRRSTVVLAVIQAHKIKAMKKRSEAAARLQKLKNAKRVSLASIKLEEQVLNRSVYSFESSTKLKGMSLSFFDNDSGLRRYLNKIEQSTWFTNAVIVSIMISTLILILENPSDNPNEPFILTLELLNHLMTLVFILEALIKIIVHGFLFNGETSYLRNIWNVMDFIIVICSFLGFFEFAGDTQFIKIMRMLRVLKPLSMVGRNQGMRTVIQSLGHAIPQFANLLLVTIMILILFSILGTIFFQGLFHYCHMANVPDTTRIVTRWDCLDYGGEWENKDANFDDVFSGLATMFEIITTEGWIEIMWSGMSTTQHNMVPETNNNVWASCFFIGAMVIGGLFLLNLFVGVVIHNFNIEKDKMFRNYMLTPLQIEYCDTMAICYKMKPRAEYVTQGITFIDYLYYVTINPYFEHTISISIVLNTIFMAVSWYEEPVHISRAMEWVNFAFSIIFTLEAAIKITVQGKSYFKDGWSLFDFVIVLASWVDFGFGQYVGHENSEVSAISLFRAFRVARLLRMIKRFHQLRKIFNTFVKSLNQLYNVALLLLLLLVLYSVLGVSFFHSVELNGSLDQHANFQSFGIAMMTLLRMTTGEAWNELMHDARRQRSILFQCTEIHDWTHGQKIKGCGQPIATLYFTSFMLIVSIIFLNMFIAIILEGFSASQQEEMARIKDDAFETFVNCWQNYDAEATGFIEIDDLELLITDLIQAELRKREGKNHRQDIMFNLHRDPKLLLFVKMQNHIGSDTDSIMEDMQRDTHLRRAVIRYINNFVSSLHIPTYNRMTCYQFHDTLATFIKYVFTVQHKEQFIEREERIERQKQTGVYIHKWDKLQEKSIAFYKMSITNQEIFLELSRPDFDEVVDRLEGKSQTKDESIERVRLMRTLRKQAARQYSNSLDYWDENVMDSSLVIGGRLVIKFVLAWKERRRLRLDREQSLSSSFQSQSAQKIQVQSLNGLESQRLFDEPYLDIAANQQQQVQSFEKSTEVKQQMAFTRIEERKISSSETLVISDNECAEFDGEKKLSSTKYQCPDKIHACNNQIVVETTIIEKKRYIIPNSQIALKLSPNQSQVQFMHNTYPRRKPSLQIEDTYKDDGSGGARVESPRLMSRRRMTAVVQQHESVKNSGDDGNGSKGRYSFKEMDMSERTLQSL